MNIPCVQSECGPASLIQVAGQWDISCPWCGHGCVDNSIAEVLRLWFHNNTLNLPGETWPVIVYDENQTVATTKTLIPCYLASCPGPAYLVSIEDRKSFRCQCKECGGLTLQRDSERDALKEWFNWPKLRWTAIVILDEINL